MSASRPYDLIATNVSFREEFAKKRTSTMTAQSGLWFTRNEGQQASLFAAAPEGIESLNGLTLERDGYRYAADDLQGAVLKLDLETASFATVLEDDLLAQHQFLAFAPDINFAPEGRSLYMDIDGGAFSGTPNAIGSSSGSRWLTERSPRFYRSVLLVLRDLFTESSMLR